MRPVPRPLILLSLSALLFGAVAASPAVSLSPAPGTATYIDELPEVRSRVQATLGNAGLDAPAGQRVIVQVHIDTLGIDRKSTRLNSSHRT